MNRSNLEQQLEQNLKMAGKTHKPMSPLVRTRLDAAYASLPDSPEQPAPQQPALTSKTRRRFPLLRRTAIAAASAVVLSSGLLASGFVSPVMADSIRSIPVIGSLFSKMEGDAGLRTAGERNQGLVVDKTAQADGMTMKVRETIFDGTRVAFALDLTLPGIENVSKLEDKVQTVNVSIDGVGELDGFFYNTPEHKGNDTYGMLMNLPLDSARAQQLGQNFEGRISVTLVNEAKPLVVTAPFKRIDAARELHLNPGPSSSNDRYTLKIDTLNITASTVQLDTSLGFKDALASTPKQEELLLDSAYEIVDDQGHVLDVVGGQGTLDNGQMKYTSNYGADLSEAKYIILKPYIRESSSDADSKAYLEGMEIKIDLNAAQ